MIVKHGPLRHVATALALPAGTAALPSGYSKAPEDLDPALKRRCEKTAEDVVVTFESARGWDCERVGLPKFDIGATGYRNRFTPP
jgi:hypothetical protein